MKVLKFGGSSLKDTEAIEHVKNIVETEQEPVCLVVSAFGTTTDELQKLANLAKEGDSSYISLLDSIQSRHIKLAYSLIGKEAHTSLISCFDQLKQITEGVFLLKELTNKSLDFILGIGELVSSTVVAEYFTSKGLDAKRFDSREYLITDRSFGEGKVDLQQSKAKLRALAPTFGAINVFPGFVAGTDLGETTTLGRGGSDYTASLIAAALDASSLEIWTDVDGIMTADPRRVKRAHTLSKVSYEEASELSYFGAKVLYPQSIAPVLDSQIHVQVKNTFSPNEPGTVISIDQTDSKIIKGISSIDEVTILSISGRNMHSKGDYFAVLFGELARHQLSVVFMTHSNAGLIVTLGFRSKDAQHAFEVIEQAFKDRLEHKVVASMNLSEGYSLLALVGSNMKDQIGVSGAMFNVLGRNGISIKAISQGSSELSISAIIPKVDLNKALNVLHETFFLSLMKRINLFIVGTGNVGREFLDQLKRQFSFLKEQYYLNLKIIGVANSRKMVFEKDGIPLSKWEEYMDGGDRFDKALFLDQMIALNYRNSIFIDITASSEIAALYKQVLEASISVVTPNKIAATRSYEEYVSLKSVARKYKSQFLIETNVCAGLPILSTLHDLIRSGDKVIRMEAVLSGTLNFLFNEYDGSYSFAKVIQKAKSLGYTEPDPRLDLSGEDVMRKLLILIRESGYEMEMDQLKITSFLPESCQNKESLELFYEGIEAEEAYFQKLYETSLANGTRLKVVASYQNGKGEVKLQEIPDSHPFYNLEGKDNVVLFYTDRYAEQPLVIKGAGAGAEVTASGIFADVLRMAQPES